MIQLCTTTTHLWTWESHLGTYVLLYNPQKVGSFTPSASYQFYAPWFISSSQMFYVQTAWGFSLTSWCFLSLMLCPRSLFSELLFQYLSDVLHLLCIILYSSRKISSRKKKMRFRNLASFLRHSQWPNKIQWPLPLSLRLYEQ